MSGRPPVLVVAATEGELGALAARLSDRTVRRAGPWTVEAGRLAGRPVGLVVTGVGKVNAGAGTAAALAVTGAETVVAVGVAGALPGSGLGVGHLAVATCEFYGDEGVQTKEGFLTLDRVGLALASIGGERVYNRWPADPAVADRLLRAAGVVGPVRPGPFLTVSTVTGTDARAQELAERFGACCENMEGAAVAHVARLHGVAFGEVRGISNPAGRRDRASWRVDEAAAAAREAAARFLEEGG